jgi:hypothetical protein
LEALEKERQKEKEDEEMNVEGAVEEDADEEQTYKCKSAPTPATTTLPAATSGVEADKRDLPLVPGLTSWKQFYWLRKYATTMTLSSHTAELGLTMTSVHCVLALGMDTHHRQIERTYLHEATQAEVDGDQPSAPLWVAEPGERTAETYLHWGALLFSKKPEVRLA